MDNGEFQDQLKKFHAKLVDELNASAIIDYLLESKVLDLGECESIKKLSTRHEKAKKILGVLHKKPTSADAFIQALERTDQDHLARLLGKQESNDLSSVIITEAALKELGDHLTPGVCHEFAIKYLKLTALETRQVESQYSGNHPTKCYQALKVWHQKWGNSQASLEEFEKILKICGDHPFCLPEDIRQRVLQKCVKKDSKDSSNVDQGQNGDTASSDGKDEVDFVSGYNSREILDQNWKKLLSKLKVDPVITHLVGDDFFHPDQLKEIRSLSNQMKKTERLMTFLQERNYSDFMKFVKALEVTGQRKLLPKELPRQKKGPIHKGASVERSDGGSAQGAGVGDFIQGSSPTVAKKSDGAESKAIIQGSLVSNLEHIHPNIYEIFLAVWKFSKCLDRKSMPKFTALFLKRFFPSVGEHQLENLSSQSLRSMILNGLSRLERTESDCRAMSQGLSLTELSHLTLEEMGRIVKQGTIYKVYITVSSQKQPTPKWEEMMPPLAHATQCVTAQHQIPIIDIVQNNFVLSVSLATDQESKVEALERSLNNGSMVKQLWDVECMKKELVAIKMKQTCVVEARLTRTNQSVPEFWRLLQTNRATGKIQSRVVADSAPISPTSSTSGQEPLGSAQAAPVGLDDTDLAVKRTIIASPTDHHTLPRNDYREYTAVSVEESPGNSLEVSMAHSSVVEHELGSATLSKMAETSLNVLLSIIVTLAYTAKDFFSHIYRMKDRIDFVGLRDKGMNLMHLVVSNRRVTFLRVFFELGYWKQLITLKVRDRASPYYNLTAFEMSQKINCSEMKLEILRLSQWEGSLSDLHKAAREGNKELMTALIKQNKELVNSKDDMYKSTPVYLAISSGQEDVIELLVKNGARLDCVTTLNDNLVTRAAALGHTNLVKLLVEKYGLDSEKPGMGKKKPVDYAVENSDLHTFRQLLKYGIQVDQRIMMAAVARSTVAFVRELVEKHKTGLKQLAPGKVTPLLQAVKYGNVKVAEYLLEKGADIRATNEARENVFHLAVESGNEDMLDFLFKATEKANAKKELLLQKCAHRGGDMLRVVKGFVRGEQRWCFLELRRTAVVDFDKAHKRGKIENFSMFGTVLEQGTGASPPEDLEERIMKRYKVESTPSNAADDCTPLLYSLIHEEVAMTRKLIEHTPDISKGDCFGLTPLHIAAQKGYRDVCVMLEKRGACLDAANQHGQSPLEMAKAHGHVEIANYLEGASYIERCRDYVKHLQHTTRVLAPEYLEEIRGEGGSLPRFIVATARELQAETNVLLYDMGSSPIQQSQVVSAQA